VWDEYGATYDLDLPPGGKLIDWCSYVRLYGGHEKWEWSGVWLGNQQTTIRIRNQWNKILPHREREIILPGGGGGGGGDGEEAK
jgi:hypothetical protein